MNALYYSTEQETNRFLYYMMQNQRDALQSQIDKNVQDISANTRQDVIKHADVGDYKWSARTQSFNGWLKCDGSEVSRTAFAELFDIVGTQFGDGDGSTTFNLPDCRGRVGAAIGDVAAFAHRALGDAVGAEAHALTVDEMPSHVHSGTTDASGNHTHTVNDPGHSHTVGTSADDGNASSQAGQLPAGDAYTTGEVNYQPNAYSTGINTTGIMLNASGQHVHTFTTASAGSGNAHSLMQPTLYIGNLFIFGGAQLA